ncbi:hypothetical protein MACH26_22330 [Planctobacterium marinum]|uniref:Peptidase S9 prolyl oligopeptidase catalytic domain-containing protein n=2 Tax=Planctobacterium marinum TaxID=1631968 RepID=A0AA48HNF6_9ALTE|nr:hypothetical protein MACH26_22330 [Planctobacterium marinum]
MGIILDTAGLDTVFPFHVDMDSVTWSLDSEHIVYTKALYPQGPDGFGYASQIDIRSLAYFPFPQSLSPHVVEIPVLTTQLWGTYQYPQVTSLLSNIGYIPYIEFENHEAKKYILDNGITYQDQYNETEDRYEIVENKRGIRKVFSHNQQSDNEFVIDWYYNPEGLPYLKAVYDKSSKSFNLKNVNQSKFVEEHPGLPTTILSYTPQVDELQLFKTFKIRGVEESRNSLWFTSNAKRNTVSLYEYSYEKNNFKLVYSDPEFDIERPLYTRRGELYGVIIYRETKEFVPLSSEGRIIHEFIKEVSPKTGLFDVDIKAVSDGLSKVVVEIAGSANYSAFLLDVKSGKGKVLLNTLIDSKYKTEALWTSTEGQEKVLSYFTKSVDNFKAPLVVHLHGGPFIRDKLQLSQLDTLLADSGYNVLRVNYRNSRGFGRSFTGSNVEHLAFLDVVTALKDAIVRMKLQPSKVILMGGSYGGYATIKIAKNTELSRNFDEFISINGSLDYCGIVLEKGRWGLSPFKNCEVEYSNKKISSKILHDKPIAIVYGTEDKNVEPSNSTTFLNNVAHLKHVFAIPLPGEGHTLTSAGLESMIKQLKQQAFL